MGKSTLINAILGEKLVITNSKAQTTRHRILGMLNTKDYQLILSDTPGIIDPSYKLQESMMQAVQSVFDDADVLIYVVEVGEKKAKNQSIIDRLSKIEKPLILAINKIDMGNQKLLDETIDAWNIQLPNSVIWSISALEKFQVNQMLDSIAVSYTHLRAHET